jgi:hypothetical protein
MPPDYKPWLTGPGDRGPGDRGGFATTAPAARYRIRRFAIVLGSFPAARIRGRKAYRHRGSLFRSPREHNPFFRALERQRDARVRSALAPVRAIGDSLLQLSRRCSHKHQPRYQGGSEETQQYLRRIGRGTISLPSCCT